MNKRSGCPPEKYYEACITHHLVRYYEMLYEKRLFPLSISQVRERELGFDFGYRASGALFFVQYKRPALIRDGMYAWCIGLEQLRILTRLPCPAFYALPAFLSESDWYDGLERTHFIPARQMAFYLRNRASQKTARITEADALFRTVRKMAFDPRRSGLENAQLAEQLTVPPDRGGLIEVLGRADAAGVWGYWTEE